jgi:hypothetical protein
VSCRNLGAGAAFKGFKASLAMSLRTKDRLSKATLSLRGRWTTSQAEIIRATGNAEH